MPHSPTLESILMVENAAKMHSGCGRYQLWSRLPKKMMYQTFQTVLDYLEQSKKIIVEGDKVIWTWNPDEIGRLAEQSLASKWEKFSVEKMT